MAAASRALLFVGLFLLPLSAASAQEDLNFYEEFQGTSLNPAFRVLNPDPQRMAMVHGEQVLLVTSKETKNIIQYEKPLPENYAVTVRIAQPPQNPEQWAHIQVGSGTSNVRVGMYVDGWKDLYFSTNKTLDGEEVSVLREKNSELLGKPVYLRLTKIGVEFEGGMSADGVQWTSLGKQVLIDPNAKISFAAGGWGDAAESPVNFDSFEIAEVLI